MAEGLPCCARWRKKKEDGWQPCDGSADFNINGKMAQKAIEYTSKDKASWGGLEHSFVKHGNGKYRVCSDCAIVVVMAHYNPKLKAHTSKVKNMKTESFCHDMLMMGGVLEEGYAVSAPNTAQGMYDAVMGKSKPKVDNSQRETRSSARADESSEEEESEDEDRDPLDELWPLARHLIPRNCFLHSIIVTSLRVLIMHDKDHVIDGAIWDRTFEGQMVLRWQVRLSPFLSNSILQALLGKITPKDKKWDVREQNLIFLASPRTVRRYAGTPFSLISVLSISSEQTKRLVSICGAENKFRGAFPVNPREGDDAVGTTPARWRDLASTPSSSPRKLRRASDSLVDSQVSILIGLGLKSKAIAVTVDKIHADPSCAVIEDWATPDAITKEPFLVGPATKDDLTGALLSYEKVHDLRKLPNGMLATGFTTFCICPLEIDKLDNGMLGWALPVAGERAAFIENSVFRIQEEFFFAGFYAVHGAGDGLNLGAMRTVSAACTGTAETKLEDCKNPRELPFTAGTDPREHDFKHTEQCGWSWELILHDEDEGFLITDEVTALRGLDSAGNPVEAGDVAHLVALGYFATKAEARPWHRKFAKFITAEVLQRKDDMKTALSVAFAQTWPLLQNLAERHVRFRGLARFAKFCWLMLRYTSIGHGLPKISIQSSLGSTKHRRMLSRGPPDPRPIPERVRGPICIRKN